ncbi:MAG: IPT/TIG domain-containing protein [Acidobacteriota bacterium]
MRRRCTTSVVIVALPVLLASASSRAGNNVWTSDGPTGGTYPEMAFHPTLEGTLFVTDGWRIFRTDNLGGSWKRLPLFGAADWHVLRMPPGSPNSVITAGCRIYWSDDLGSSWRVTNPFPWEDWRDEFYDFELHPSNPKVMYGVTYDNGVFKSVDGGITWQKKNSGLNLKPFDPVHRCKPQIEVDPKNGNKLYVLLPCRAAYRSTDGGESWQKASKGLTLGGGSGVESEWCLRIDHNNPRTLYAGAANGVFKTTDAGASWSNVYSDSDIISIGIDAVDSRTIYSVGGGLNKSTDAGATWVKLDKPIDAIVPTMSVGAHPTQADLVFFCAAGSGMWRSKNGGKSWVEVNRELYGRAIERIDSGGGHLFAVSEPDVLRRPIRGGNWQRLPTGDFWPEDLCVDPSNGTSILVAGETGCGGMSMAYTTDGGRSWEVKSVHEDSRSVACAIDPRDGDTMYLALLEGCSSNPIGVAKTTDRGKKWNLCNKGLADKGVVSIAIDPRHSHKLIVATMSARVFRTENAGQTWKECNISHTPQPWRKPDITFDPRSSNIIYYTNDSAGLFRSTDGGRTWSSSNSQITGGIEFHPADPRTVFGCGKRGSVYVSTDAAATWTSFDSTGLASFHMHDVLIDPDLPETLVAATDCGVYSYSRKATHGGPVIEQLAPPAARIGDTITINGQSFGQYQSDSTVQFGTVGAGTAQFWSDTSIRVAVPSGAKTGALIVTVLGKKSNPFEFILLPSSGNVEPTSGPPTGGTRVTILAPSGTSGTQFNVLFGSAVASNIRFTQPNVITCDSPPGTGTVDVKVTSSVTSTTVGSFTYQ